MKNIYENKNLNFETFFNIARKSGVYINKKIYVRQSSKYNNGIFVNEGVDINQNLISLPRKLFISEKTFTDFLLDKKVNYENLEFLRNYFFSLPSLEYFKKNNIFFLEKEKKNYLLNFFIEQSPTRIRINHFFENFNKLSDLEKYIALIFKTRSFKYENNQYLFPIVDLINYKYGEPLAIYNKAGMLFENKKILKSNDEFYQGYDYETNIVSFYLNYNFIPENFNTISIPANFFYLDISKKIRDILNENYWHFNNNKLSNKKQIVFFDLNLPLEFKLEIAKIFPNNSEIKKFVISILQMLKNEIDKNKLFKFLQQGDSKSALYPFAKTLQINVIKIDQMIKTLKT